jgi:uncharacterized membrane-anchored protein YjiN (DUF445 family)
MKYLKTFENSYERTIVYEYVSEQNRIKIENFVREYMNKDEFFKKVNRLNKTHFENDNYIYRDIFNTILSANKYIYWEIDRFCLINDINESAPAIRNTLVGVLQEIYKEYYSEFKQKLDDKLVSIFEKNPDEYKSKYRLISQKLNSDVKKRCEWMLMTDKYNL